MSARLMRAIGALLLLVGLVGPAYAGTDAVARGLAVGARANALNLMRSGVRAVSFGNSVSLQQAMLPYAVTVGNCTVDIAAGQTVVPVSSIAGFTNGDTVEMVLYDGSLFTSTATFSGTNVTLATPLPKLLRGTAVGGVNVVKKSDPLGYGYYYATAGWLRVLNAKMGNPFNFVNVYGYGGADSNQFVGEFDRAVTAYKPQVVFIQALENDVRDIALGTMTVAQSIANLNTMIAKARAAGIIPIVGTSLPSTGFTTAGSVAAFDKLNDYVMSLPRQQPGVIVLPFHLIWQDFTSSTSRIPQSGALYSDGLHPNSYGAHVLAQAFYPILNPLFGVAYQEQWSSGRANANNYVVNPMMIGTGGTVQAPVTGSAPTNWVVGATSSLGTGVSATAASSIIADGAQKAWQVTWSHTATSDHASNNVDMRTLAATISPGTTVIGRVEMSLSSFTNLGAYSVWIDVGGNQINKALSSVSTDAGVNPSSGTITPIGSGRLVLETPPVTVPAGSTSVVLHIITSPAAGTTASGATVTVYKAAISPVSLPVSYGYDLPANDNAPEALAA